MCMQLYSHVCEENDENLPHNHSFLSDTKNTTLPISQNISLMVTRKRTNKKNQNLNIFCFICLYIFGSVIFELNGCVLLIANGPDPYRPHETRCRQPYRPLTWKKEPCPVKVEKQVHASPKEEAADRKIESPQAVSATENPEYWREPELPDDYFINMSPEPELGTTTRVSQPQGEEH